MNQANITLWTKQI